MSKDATAAKATKVYKPIATMAAEGKHYFPLGNPRTIFEIDTKYFPIRFLKNDFIYDTAVCVFLDTESKENVAIKKSTENFENKLYGLRTLREIRLLRQLRHQNITHLKDIMKPTDRYGFNDVYIVHDIMATNLHHIIQSPQTLVEDHYRYILYQVLRGLKYLHSANVFHHNLMPENILINAVCEIKISEFGLSNPEAEDKFAENMSIYPFNEWYKAPEQLLFDYEFDTSIDMWSVGCIFAELLGRKRIFPADCLPNQLKQIISAIGNPSEDDLKFIHCDSARKYIKALPTSPHTSVGHLFPNADAAAIDLLDKMLVFNPNKRISVTEALEHPYLSSLHDPNNEPTAEAPFDMGIDEKQVTVEELRELVWKEMLYYHPESADSTELPVTA